LHQAGNEIAWWENLGINAPEIVKGLWEENHARLKPIGEANISPVNADSSIVKVFDGPPAKPT
jgi:hypothetical protein